MSSWVTTAGFTCSARIERRLIEPGDQAVGKRAIPILWTGRHRTHVPLHGRAVFATAAHAIGATQISEILSVPEATRVGEYPAALQVKTTYSAIIIEGTERLEDAQKLIQFFLGPDFQSRLARSGFEPVPPSSN